MAITPANIKMYKSTTTVSGISSLGGAVTATEVVSGVANNLWDDVSSAESSAGDTEYRCVYIKNTHATLTLTAPNVLWLASQTANGHTLAIGVDPAAVGNGTTTGVATTVASETTAPAGVTFASPLTKAASSITFLSLTPGQVKAIWLRRVVAAGSISAAFSPVIQFEGTTLP